VTDRERRAKADSKLREAGLTRIPIWVPVDDKSAVYELGDTLRDGLTPSEYAERVNDEHQD